MDNKLKIVYIISHLNIGGAQTLVFDILKYLNKKKDLDISIITIDSGENINKFRIEGINIINISEKGLVNPKIFFRLKESLRKIKPDIVHTHMLKADFYGRIAAKQAGVPLIYSTCHNYSSHHKGADVNKISIFDKIDNAVISYSDSKLIAISEIVKKYLVNRNEIFKAITEVIYNGVDIEKEKYILNDYGLSELRKDIGILKDDFVISIIGRIEKQKGHAFFLDSVSGLLKERKNIKVLIIGDGNLKNEIENLVTANQLTDYVKLLGYQIETEKFIEISDLICVPSLWEGFGLVIIEAMIKMKIVLATDTGGISEIIENGKTGYLFKLNDKKSISEKLIYIINNFNDLNHIKLNALRMVKEKFDIRKNSEKYYQSYLNHLNFSEKVQG